MNDLYSRLLEGETADDIAASFAEELNAAIARIEEEKKAAEEAKQREAELAARETEKTNAAVNLIYDAYKFLRDYYPDLIDVEITDATDLQKLAELVCLLLDNSQYVALDPEVVRDLAFNSLVDSLFKF